MADQYSYQPPTADELERRRRQDAALAAGAAMLMASGGNRNLGQALGAGGLAMLNSRANSQQAARDDMLAGMQMEDVQRKNAQARALEQALPELIQKQFAPDAVASAAQRYPGAALPILDAVEKRNKAKLEQTKIEADIQDKRLKVAEKFANQAAYLAKGNPTPQQVQKFAQSLEANGVSGVLGQVPFQSWANPDEAKSNLSAMASMFYDIKDRVSQDETGRHNLTSEQQTAANNAALAADRERNYKLSAARFGLEQQNANKMQFHTGPNGEPLFVDPRTQTVKVGSAVDAAGNPVDMKPKNLDSGTRDLAKMIDANSLPNLSSTIRSLNATLEKYAGTRDIPGVGYFEGFAPGWMQSAEGKAVRSQIQGVANDLLKLYSGGAVTLNEAERRTIEMMANGGYTENDLYTGWPLIVNRYNSAIQNIGAGFSPEVVQTYRKRGGTAMEPIVPAQRTFGKKPAGALTPDEERELAARRARSGQ
jgi:hypothetical protein